MKSDENEAMSTENIVKHFSRLQSIMNTTDIMEPTRIFIVNLLGFSIRGVSLGRLKRVVRNGKLGNTCETKFAGRCNHVILMSFVTAAGRVFTPLLLLPEKEAN